MVWFDTSGSSLVRGPRYFALRALRNLRAGWHLLTCPPANIYLVCDAGPGIWATLVLVTLATLRGHPVWLHHHSWAYVDSGNRAMRLMAALGDRVEHIALANDMATRLMRTYPRIVRVRAADNAMHCDDQGVRSDLQAGAIRLGHMSNLSVAKGTETVIETFEELAAADPDLRLVLAGPISEPAIEQRLARARANFGDRISYLGPVYGEAKRAFFQSVDLFLFPTRYRHEAYPMVLLEALSAGVPCVVTERGLTPHAVGEAGAITTPQDFPRSVERTIARFRMAPQQSAERARRQYEKLAAVGRSQLDALIAALSQEAGPQRNRNLGM